MRGRFSGSITSGAIVVAGVGAVISVCITPACAQAPESSAIAAASTLKTPWGEPDLQGIDWIIAGGESGQKARPFNTDWALEILASAQKHHVPFFMKQLGTHLSRLAGKKGLKGGDMADFPPALQVRQFPDEAEASPKSYPGSDVIPQ